MIARQRWVVFACLVALVSLVSDGWSGKPSPRLHQLLLLPLSVCMAAGLVLLLSDQPGLGGVAARVSALPRWWWAPLVAFEGLSIGFIGAEAHHFKAFGYRFTATAGGLAAVVVFAALLVFWRHPRGRELFSLVLVAYAAGLGVAIAGFPLNYLRSDMLPVIGWADARLLHLHNPYSTMHVGQRLYDFPYLPGMLVAFWPAVAASVDLRFATAVYLGGTAFLIYGSALSDRRLEVAALLGLFLLCPFLQYRHDLYL